MVRLNNGFEETYSFNGHLKDILNGSGHPLYKMHTCSDLCIGGGHKGDLIVYNPLNNRTALAGNVDCFECALELANWVTNINKVQEGYGEFKELLEYIWEHSTQWGKCSYCEDHGRPQKGCPKVFSKTDAILGYANIFPNESPLGYESLSKIAYKCDLKDVDMLKRYRLINLKGYLKSIKPPKKNNKGKYVQFFKISHPSTEKEIKGYLDESLVKWDYYKKGQLVSIVGFLYKGDMRHTYSLNILEENPAESYSQNSKRKISPKLRSKVLKRDNYTCQHCGKTVEDGVKLEIDHMIPVSLGGTDDIDNLQVLCMECNRGKSNDFCG